MSDISPPAVTLPTILLVDDDPGIIQALSKVLRPLARLRFATSGPDALRLLREAPPDLLLLDSEMPGMSGLQVFEALRGDPLLAELAVIFVTGWADEAFEQRCLDLGAADFIAKPVRPAILQARVRTQLRLKQALDELKHTASTDALTGIANRRSFDAALLCHWALAARGARALSLLFIDVDHFKRYNDHYGHAQGDSCLAAVARAIAASLGRPSDLACRFGGEEFTVLLPDTDAKGGQQVAQRVLEAVAALGLPHAASPVAHQVTVSIGLCSLAGAAGTAVVSAAGARFSPPLQARDLVEGADRALYEAKQGGRARVVARMLLAQPAAG